MEQHEETGEETSEGAAGTMLAGQEAPEQVGVIKSLESTEMIVITVAGQDVTYRLSEDAKQQVENNEVAAGSDVTFTTYSIGDQTETIDTFLSK